MSYPQGQPPYQQPYNPQQQPQKKPGLSTGLKLAIGGCLLLVVLGGGFMVACGVWIKTVSKELKDSNLSGTGSVTASPDSNDTIAQPTLTMEKYNRITNGMKLHEVEEILGSKGKQLSGPINNNNAKIIYTWQEGEATTTRIIRITFVNEKVQEKSQSGVQ
jgi:hypothetical protein